MAEIDNEPKVETGNDAAFDAAERHANRAAGRLDAKLSGPLAPVEKALDGVFGTKAAYQLPADMKDLLAQIAPWLSLISGVLGLYSAYNMWRVAHFVGRYAEAFGMSQFVKSSNLSVMFWLSFGSTILFAILALLAFPGLKARKKIGWNLIFYSMLVNVVIGILLFLYRSGSATSLLSALILSGIGFYILFQIRDRYCAKV